MPKILFPPRPKGKIAKTDLPYYESTGQWLAQRKFNGAGTLIHVEPNGNIHDLSRHGTPHRQFSLTNAYINEIRANLRLEKGVEYWLHGEVMTKTKVRGEEIVFYDLLQVGHYFFAKPDQMTRLKMLADICGNPTELEPGGKALQISERLWLAETFLDHFVDRFNESLSNDLLEGLVIRKRTSTLDHWGTQEYETNWLIRCRKPFMADASGNSKKGYNF